MYGRDGSGFALKFKGKALSEKIDVPLVKINYDKQEQRSHLRELLAIGRETSQQAYDAAKARLGEGWAERTFRIAGQAFGGVISLHAATMKGPEFAAEKEWRLVHAGMSKTKAGVDARGPILRTYFDVEFEPDDLVAVIVGPVHAELNRPVLSRLLAEHGYANTTVEIGTPALRTLREDR